MPNRLSKKTDLNQLAKSIVDYATTENIQNNTVKSKKNPAAVALGRLGGLKGGKARAQRLSKNRRSEIAKKAARKRWGYED